MLKCHALETEVICVVNDNHCIDNIWCSFRDSLLQIATRNILNCPKKTKTKPWVSRHPSTNESLQNLPIRQSDVTISSMYKISWCVYCLQQSFVKQTQDSCKKATGVLHMLRCNLKKAATPQKLEPWPIRLFCRPVLEYATHVWSPHITKYAKPMGAINTLTPWTESARSQSNCNNTL